MELNIIKDKIGQLRTAEGQVKTLVSELIIAVTDRIHEHDDVDSANLFLLALTPINRKKALSFLKAHSGHKVEEDILTKRRKEYIEKGEKVDPYKEAHDKFEDFKASGMDFWQWAVAKVEKVEKPVTLDVITKRAKAARDALSEGLIAGVVDKVQAFEMLTGGVFSYEDLNMMLGVMAKAEDAVTQAAKASIAA